MVDTPTKGGEAPQMYRAKISGDLGRAADGSTIRVKEGEIFSLPKGLNPGKWMTPISQEEIEFLELVKTKPKQAQIAMSELTDKQRLAAGDAPDGLGGPPVRRKGG